MKYEVATFAYPGWLGELPPGWVPIAYHPGLIIARRKLPFWQRSRPDLFLRT